MQVEPIHELRERAFDHYKEEQRLARILTSHTRLTILPRTWQLFRRHYTAMKQDIWKHVICGSTNTSPLQYHQKRIRDYSITMRRDPDLRRFLIHLVLRNRQELMEWLRASISLALALRALSQASLLNAIKLGRITDVRYHRLTIGEQTLVLRTHALLLRSFETISPERWNRGDWRRLADATCIMFAYLRWKAH